MLFTLVYAVEHVVGFEHGAIGLWHFQQALSRFVLLLGLIARVHVLHRAQASEAYMQGTFCDLHWRLQPPISPT